ncbi:lysylphosphatidylglycerol synthase transmembrane domain-containing protein [Dysgonomonas sp. 520]|uniref:lysylphosphatidylglycerol synthase transmembrane domain-containing protein n=1 Tax=Dysgonomonas sp. 520 TaxID=2302931 RepID=UPI0013D6425D|nr:lysylphosphatidylglycerol synthase transmembrane domain-containing protein [Dysgonomonas sp. 520]NDW11017.1 UPF0104 family protein [Dysgonomonas sp. 520]
MSDTVVQKKKEKKSKLNSFIKIFVPLGLGIVILYFLYRDTNFVDLWRIIKNANWAILTFSLIFGLLGNVIRGLRWRLIIDPLGYHPRKSSLVYAVLGNYAVNFALPRAGEIWRCGVISKEEKIPFKKLIGTLIIDRVFDTLMVALILLLAFVCNATVFLRKSSEFNIPPFLTSVWFYVAVAASLVVVIAIFAIFKENKIVKKVREFLLSIWNDMKTVKTMKEKKRFLIYTVSIWIAYFLYFFVTFYAFDFTSHLGIAAGLFVFALSSVSMAIPSNGGLGPWQAAVVFALMAFAIQSEQAIAFATAVFTFQSIWVVLCGLFGIAALSFNKEKK